MSKKNKTKKKNRQNRYQLKLKKKIEKSGKKVVVEPSGAIRMSEVLQDFAEPLLKESVTDAEVKDAIKFSILVWNASLVPTPDRENILELLIENLADSDQPGHTESIKYYVNMLLKRKETMFPDLNRIIVDFRFSGSESTLRFDVASSLS